MTVRYEYEIKLFISSPSENIITFPKAFYACLSRFIMYSYIHVINLHGIRKI